MSDHPDQPISSVVWRSRDTLRANDYNPNHVAPPELRLLEQSIVEDGWTQPIVIRPTDEAGVFEIVDGFHRWTVSDRPRLRERDGGDVPTVLINPDRATQQMSTIRHNRARGKHHVVKMADIVDQLVEGGMTPAEAQERLGMSAEELDRLTARGRMIERGAGEEFNASWRPSTT